MQPAWEHDNRGNKPRVVGYEITNLLVLVVRALDRLGATVDAALAAGATSLDGLDLRLAEPGPIEAQA